MVIGVFTIASSWWSVRPSSEHRYQDLMARRDADPESVSWEELVMIKDDEGMTAISIILYGIPGFVLFSLAGIGMSNPRRKSPLSLFLGSSWILLGVGLHILAWL